MKRTIYSEDKLTNEKKKSSTITPRRANEKQGNCDKVGKHKNFRKLSFGVFTNTNHLEKKKKKVKKFTGKEHHNSIEVKQR